MIECALEGGARLHAICSLRTSLPPEMLDAIISYTAPTGPEPDAYTYRLALAFKRFNEEVVTIDQTWNRPR